MHTYIHTGVTHAYIQTETDNGRQTHIQTNIQAQRLAETQRQTYRHKQLERLIQTETHIYTEWTYTHIQAYKRREIQTETHTAAHTYIHTE